MSQLIKRAKSLAKAAAAYLGIRLIDPVEVFYLPHTNTFYPIISKSACSSIKLMLIRRFNPEYVAKFPDIHHINPAILTENQLQRLFFYTVSEYEKWASGKKLIFVMREPMERFYSCYIDVKTRKNIMYRFPSELDWFMNFKAELTLNAFLEKISGISDAFSDRHFRSQSFYLTDEIRKTASAVEKYSLGTFMKHQKTKRTDQNEVRLNTNTDSLDSELRVALLNNATFTKRFAADLKLYSEIENNK